MLAHSMTVTAKGRRLKVHQELPGPLRHRRRAVAKALAYTHGAQRHTAQNVCGDAVENRKLDAGAAWPLHRQQFHCGNKTERCHAIVWDHCMKYQAPLYNRTTRLFRVASVANTRNTTLKNNCQFDNLFCVLRRERFLSVDRCYQKGNGR